MNHPTRERLECLAAFLAERIGPSTQSCDPIGRTVRHAITGIEAYLGAVESGNGVCIHLRAQADELWESLARIAANWPDAPHLGPQATEPPAVVDGVAVPAATALGTTG
ncbi:hypothetical protein ACWGB8_24610 [Kitasatospora sp. NPDC054939]